MNDMITVFNQLTQSELTDYSLFETVLENHYEKYRLFYSLMEPINLSTVEKIYCETPADESSLEITIVFKTTEERDTFAKSFHSQLIASTDTLMEYFSVSLGVDENDLNISIENKNICREGEIYEDRFDSY